MEKSIKSEGIENNISNVVTVYGDYLDTAMQSENPVRSNFDEEEIKVYRDLFPELVLEIKDYLLTEYNFIQKENKIESDFVSIISREHLNLNGEKKPLFEIVLPQKESPSWSAHDKFTIRINIHLPKAEIKEISGFFKSKQETVYSDEQFVIFAFHIQPVDHTLGTRIGYTSDYGEILKWYSRDSFDKFFDDIEADDIIINEDYDVAVVVEDVEGIIDEFHEKVQNEYKRRSTALKGHQHSYLSTLDKDSDGNVDLVDADTLSNLLVKHQTKLIQLDKSYIQKFVKIVSYLRQKRDNTQKIFDSIKETKNHVELEERVSLLRNQIHTYNLLVFHSISMIAAAVESDLITFYEIYECFDKLSVFNSNWENEVSSKLDNIGIGISELLYSIYRMERNIVVAINNLTYVTQAGFSTLNNTINTELKSINSSIHFNNLLTSIQTYKMFQLKNE
jgi:hypothetical protein